MTKPLIINGVTLRSSSKKNQSIMNKAVRAMIAYNKANDIRNKAEDEGLNLSLFNRQCENLFDRYLQYAEELSQADIKLIEKVLF